MVDYKLKYIKYKNKYLKLKGGANLAGFHQIHWDNLFDSMKNIKKNIDYYNTKDSRLDLKTTEPYKLMESSIQYLIDHPNTHTYNNNNNKIRLHNEMYTLFNSKELKNMRTIKRDELKQNFIEMFDKLFNTYDKEKVSKKDTNFFEKLLEGFSSVDHSSFRDKHRWE